MMRPVALVAVLLVGGCQTYLDARADAAAGGPERRTAAAQGRLASAQREQENLKDQQVAVERDVERMEARLKDQLATTEESLRALDAARRERRIDDGRYGQLKGELDRLQGELRSLDLQVKAEALGGAPDLAAKQERLRALEARKVELERLIRLTRR
jgi:chromosome segregation ATPase